MRIHFLGNTCNNNYVLAKELRTLGVDAHLFYKAEGKTQTLPQSEDSELEHGLPHWLHPISSRPASRGSPIIDATESVLAEIANCDLIHAHGLNIDVAARTQRPFVWHPFGGDLIHYPFYGLWFWQRLVRRGVTWREKLLTPMRMRRAARDAAAILMGWHDDHRAHAYRYLQQHGMWDKVLRAYIGIHPDKYNVLTDEERRALRRAMVPDVPEDCLVIFHPTRQSFSRWRRREFAKGNDILYQGLARFQRECGRNYRLVVVDKQSQDDQVARQLMQSLGIADQVTWVPFMKRFELRQWYQVADITADQFSAGTFGSVGLESMSCGTTVMARLRTQGSTGELFLDPHDLFAQLPPLFNVESEEDIASALRVAYEDRAALVERGAQCRDWVLAHAEARVSAQRLLSIYERILAPLSAQAKLNGDAA